MSDTVDTPVSNRKAKKIEERENIISNAVNPNKFVDGLNVEKILQIARSNGHFSVDRYKWAQSKMRRKLWGMKEAGLLTGGRNQSGVLVYYAVKKEKSA